AVLILADEHAGPPDAAEGTRFLVAARLRPAPTERASVHRGRASVRRCRAAGLDARATAPEGDRAPGRHGDQGDRAAGARAGVAPGEAAIVVLDDVGGRGRGRDRSHAAGIARAVAAGHGVATVILGAGGDGVGVVRLRIEVESGDGAG